MASLSLILSGCSGQNVTLLDKEQCVDEGDLGAHCAHEYSSATRDIGQPEWDETRFGWFCMNLDDTVENKKESEEFCSLNGITCTVQAKQELQTYIHHHFQFAKTMRHHARAAKERLNGGM